MIITQKAVSDKGMQKVIFENLKKNKTFSRNKILLPIGGVVFLALGLAIVFKAVDINIGLGIASLILAAMFFLAIPGTYIFLKNKIKNNVKAFAEVNPEIIIDDEKIQVKTSKTTVTNSWGDFTLEDYPDYIAFVKADGQMLVLKKSELKQKEVRWILTREGESNEA